MLVKFTASRFFSKLRAGRTVQQLGAQHMPDRLSHGPRGRERLNTWGSVPLASQGLELWVEGSHPQATCGVVEMSNVVERRLT